jgi:hypothetical protein
MQVSRSWSSRSYVAPSTRVSSVSNYFASGEYWGLWGFQLQQGYM